jgi:GTP cyclohydrolase I
MYELQGRLTSQSAERLVDELDPRGVVVVIDAEHLCMTMRGVQNPESKLSSCSELPDDPASRATRRSD